MNPIKKPARLYPRVVNRPPEYIKLINSTRWRKLRNSYLVKQPLCERCVGRGKTEPATLVHHIDPLEYYLDNPEMMERLCYDPSNLMALCDTCHGIVHSEISSRSKEGHKARKQALTHRFVSRFLERGVEDNK